MSRKFHPDSFEYKAVFFAHFPIKNRRAEGTAVGTIATAICLETEFWYQVSSLRYSDFKFNFISLWYFAMQKMKVKTDQCKRQCALSDHIQKTKCKKNISKIILKHQIKYKLIVSN